MILGLFTLPKLYEMRKDDIDGAVGKARVAAQQHYKTGRAKVGAVAVMCGRLTTVVVPVSSTQSAANIQSQSAAQSQQQPHLASANPAGQQVNGSEQALLDLTRSACKEYKGNAVLQRRSRASHAQF